MKKLVIIGAVLLFVSSAFSQIPRSLDPFRISIDVARFRGADDSTGLVEVYYALPQRSLTYLADTSGLSGGMDISIEIRRKDSLLFADRWLAPSKIRDTADLLEGMNIVGVSQVQLPRGEFAMKVLGRDRNSPARRDSVFVKFPLQPTGSNRVLMSDIELASTIRKSSNHTPFYKNTLEVIPDVGGVFGGDQPCYYYAEVYNLLLGQERSGLIVHTSINDAIGREKFAQDKEKKRLGESMVVVDQVGLGTLHTGTYTLVVSILDSSKKTLALANRKLFVLNQKLGMDSTLLTAGSSLPLTVLAMMTEPELDDEFKQARYDASETEISQFKLIKGVDAKRTFLSAFWRRRPPGYRDEYMARITYANANYRNMRTPGYRSDRGRVYIVYGPPDENERHASESDSRAYEIWSYHNIQGGVIFVFVQRNSTGEYDLVHSTDRNELHDDSWQRYLNPNFDQNQIYRNSPQY